MGLPSRPEGMRRARPPAPRQGQPEVAQTGAAPARQAPTGAGTVAVGAGGGLVLPGPGRGRVAVRMPERIPWSQLGEHFHGAWGRPQPEHFEVIGPSGTGKTYLLATVMGERAQRRGTAAVAVVTKQADDTWAPLGWPTVDSIADVRRNRECVYWPKTSLRGSARKRYHERKVRELLDWLWRPDAHVMVQLDETGYLESLSAELRDTIQMYWREARSHKITMLAGKQRPQGALREMHSETFWTAAFAPSDEGDMDRYAELFGPKPVYREVFRQLDQGRREFLFRHSRSGEIYISWVDTPLRPMGRREVAAGTRMYGHAATERS